MVTLHAVSFNTQKFYVLPTQCIYVFCIDLRTTAIISIYSINWVVFITETLVELAEVRWLTTFRPNHRSVATAFLRKLSPLCICALALCHVQKTNNLSVLK